MSSSLVPSATATIEQLHRDGYAVIEDVLDRATVRDLRDRVEGLLRHEREHPFDPGADRVEVTPDEVALAHFDKIWQLSDDERRALRPASGTASWRSSTRRGRSRPTTCASASSTSRRCSTTVARSASSTSSTRTSPSPPSSSIRLLLDVMDAQLGSDAVILDMSVNHVGPTPTAAAGTSTHRSPRCPSRCPTSRSSIQSAWMLDDFTATTAPPTSCGAATSRCASRRRAATTRRTRWCWKGRRARSRCGCRRPGIATAPTSPTRRAAASSSSTAGRG